MLATLTTVVTNPVTVAFAKKAAIRLALFGGSAFVGEIAGQGVRRRDKARKVAWDDAVSHADTAELAEEIERVRNTRSHLIHLQRINQSTDYADVIARLSMQLIEMQRELQKAAKAHIRRERASRKIRLRAEISAWKTDTRNAAKRTLRPTTILMIVAGSLMGVAYQFGQVSWLAEKFPQVSSAVARIFFRIGVGAESVFWGSSVFAFGWKVSQWRSDRVAAKNPAHNHSDAMDAIHNLTSSERVQEILDTTPIKAQQLLGAKANIRSFGYVWAGKALQAHAGLRVKDVRDALYLTIADEQEAGRFVPSRATLRAFIAGARKRITEFHTDPPAEVIPISDAA